MLRHAAAQAFERLATVQRSLDTRPEALTVSIGPRAALTGAAQNPVVLRSRGGSLWDGIAQLDQRRFVVLSINPRCS